MNTPKTNGQIAYEAYCGHTDWKSLVNHKPLPPWEEVKPDIKAAWEASAASLIGPFQIATFKTELLQAEPTVDLLDEFAKQAMNALILKWGTSGGADIATAAYGMAGHMIEARAKIKKT